MSPRPYRPGRRAESAEETRRRIVEATFALHEEQGIAATSMKQIAARAGVSVGTVYHHFPTYEEAVDACGAHAAALVPAPTEEVLAGSKGAEARLGRLVSAWFDYYERLPLFAELRHARLKLTPILRFVAEADANRRDLIGLALGGAGARAADLAMALTDPAVHASLRRDGWSCAEAADAVARTILAALAGAAR
jgi:AcrR family transcriptional regulator